MFIKDFSNFDDINLISYLIFIIKQNKEIKNIL